jgi:hypothetical protein
MNRRILVGACALALALSGTSMSLASAAGPTRADPFDGGSSSSAGGITDVLQTLPFALGEVDLSSLGVSNAELASVGLAGAGIYSAGDGPNMRIVDDDQAQCPNAAYTSIQAAVTASDAGDRIKVCPGLYQEQITIPDDKDDLVLFSRNPLEAVIKAPPVMSEPGDIILVDGAQGVGIRHFKITGPLSDNMFCSLEIRTGIRVRAGGSATIWGNHITQIRSSSPALRGCQNGIAVAAGRMFQGQTGTIELSHNLIDLYQKGGVYVDNAGSYGQIDHNEIIGTPTDIIAPNGVQISRGAGARVNHNKISLNQYLAPVVAGTGIILFQSGPGQLRVDHNAVFRNDDGISLYDTDGEQIDHNNSYEQTKYDGLYADFDSRDNTFAENKAYDNFEHDCHDDSVGGKTAGTANDWLHNQGETENRPGLCKGATVT